MKRSTLFAALVLSVSVLISGVIMPGGAEAYNGDVHHNITTYARYVLGADGYDISGIEEFKDSIAYGSRTEDAIDLIWDYRGSVGGECEEITHFWDPDLGINDIMDYAPYCSGQNAMWKAQILWGMALGQYRTANEYSKVDFPDSWVTHMIRAYQYLGHTTHLLGDMTVPAHAHKDAHPTHDRYEHHYLTVGDISDEELDYLAYTVGPVEFPENFSSTPARLYWLFYTTAQLTGLFASDDVKGNQDDPLFWTDFSLYTKDASYWKCTTIAGVESDDENDEDYCDMSIIRNTSYFRGITASAALFRLFEEQAKKQDELTVVIDQIEQLGGHGATDDPDYYVRVMIGDVDENNVSDEFWFRNQGEQAETAGTTQPGWAFARDVGRTGLATVGIQLFDDDEGGSTQSDIYSGPDPNGNEKNLWMTVDLATGFIHHRYMGIIGECGQQLVH